MPKKITISVERARGRVSKRNPDLVKIADIPYLVHVTGAGNMTGQEYASKYERAFRYAMAWRLCPNGVSKDDTNQQYRHIPDKMTITYNYS